MNHVNIYMLSHYSVYKNISLSNSINNVLFHKMGVNKEFTRPVELTIWKILAVDREGTLNSTSYLWRAVDANRSPGV